MDPNTRRITSRDGQQGRQGHDTGQAGDEDDDNLLVLGRKRRRDSDMLDGSLFFFFGVVLTSTWVAGDFTQLMLDGSHIVACHGAPRKVLTTARPRHSRQKGGNNVWWTGGGQKSPRVTVVCKNIVRPRFFFSYDRSAGK